MFDVNHVSNMLKEARIRKNLTQSSLADKLNVTYAFAIQFSFSKT